MLVKCSTKHISVFCIKRKRIACILLRDNMNDNNNSFHVSSSRNCRNLFYSVSTERTITTTKIYGKFSQNLRQTNKSMLQSFPNLSMFDESVLFPNITLALLKIYSQRNIVFFLTESVKWNHIQNEFKAVL